MRVLIVGAGPTGLTAAVELARRGVVADVIEQRDKGSTFSRAVGITPRSLGILQQSGVTERLLNDGIKMGEVKIYSGSDLTLHLALTTQTPHHGHDFLLALAQDRTETHLADVFGGYGGTVRYGTELIDLRQNQDEVVVETKGGQETSFDYVVGADGIRSTTRQRLGIEFPGHDLPDLWSIADVDADDWPNWDIFTVCRMSNGNVVVVAPLEPRRFRVISNTKDSLATLPLEMNVTNIRRQGTFEISIRQVAEYQHGRVFLAGDAAHCHSPVGGRGMNLGIADAAELAERMVNGQLDGYGASRHGDGAATIAASEQARKLLTSSNPFVRGFVFTMLKAVSGIPALQRRTVQTILYG